MALLRRNGITLWRSIRDTIAQEIADGVLPPGQRLATEAELAGRFGVNRHTLRRAMADLEETGLIRIEQGRGTFVAEDLIDYALGKRTRFSQNMARVDRTAGGELIRGEIVPAEPDVAKALGIGRGAPVVVLERLCLADGRPTNVSAHHFPAARFPGLVEAFREAGSITGALAKLGVPDYLRQRSRITAILPDEADARFLRQPRSQPVLLVESVNVDPEGRPIEFSRSRFSAQRVQLVVEPLAD